MVLLGPFVFLSHSGINTCAYPCVWHHRAQSPPPTINKHVIWPLQDGFIVETASGQMFTDVDLSDAEWTEYDEKLGDSVEIMSLEWRFDVHK